MPLEPRHSFHQGVPQNPVRIDRQPYHGRIQESDGCFYRGLGIHSKAALQASSNLSRVYLFASFRRERNPYEPVLKSGKNQKFPGSPDTLHLQYRMPISGILSYPIIADG